MINISTFSLEGAGPFTVFAPTNDAFAKLPAGTVDKLVMPDMKPTLTRLLTDHVVAGTMTSANLMKAIKDGSGMANLKTVEGGTLTAKMDGQKLVLIDEKGGGATVEIADVVQAGATAAAALAFGIDVMGLRLDQAFAQTGVDLGSGDVGVLDYAYALDQLEAAFYTQVLASPYSGMTGSEQSLFRDIEAHEVAHRGFFAKALGGNRIPNLTPNFSAVDFSSRDSVLSTAATLEDLGVAAYDGGGAAIQSPKILAAAGSMVGTLDSTGQEALSKRDR